MGLGTGGPHQSETLLPRLWDAFELQGGALRDSTPPFVRITADAAVTIPLIIFFGQYVVGKMNNGPA
ncbi:hypothetical protein OUZ56_022405 [Daphnia magna]|uniref:Uncharacterized protein n=1 Tax=Daphnia magna TaxID=35525 RepID=A0ABR0AWA8_9CRUS|nr:hypothetical protein OUZ56_022405 [Daphnia magna]